MTIATAILKHYPDLNDAQREVIAHLDGPLLVVAGPGSGKTYSIVLRALNLLLLEIAAANEIVLCSFTEKAAFEMRDRISAAARTVGYRGDLSELRVTTIHGLCTRILMQHRHRTELGNSYETLDELTQLLFIFEHFDKIIGPEENNGKWKTRWTAIEGARGYFDKITEELVDAARLSASPDLFTQNIARAYHAYETALFASNRTDFAHLQSIVHGLLLPLPSITGTVEGTVTDYNAGYGRRLASGSVGGDGGKKNAWSLIDLIDLVVDHHSHDG